MLRPPSERASTDADRLGSVEISRPFGSIHVARWSFAPFIFCAPPNAFATFSSNPSACSPAAPVDV